MLLPNKITYIPFIFIPFHSNHELVQRNFDKTIWICVSNEFDDKKILREILESLTYNSCALHTKDAILKSLKKELQEKRYLLILDDVWNEDKWNGIKCI